MNTTTSLSFDDTIPAGLSARDTTFLPAKALRPVQSEAAPMPESLWRHTLQEQWADRRYRIVSRNIFATLAALTAGSLAYALGQTCALMAGNHLQNAIAVLLR